MVMFGRRAKSGELGWCASGTTGVALARHWRTPGAPLERLLAHWLATNALGSPLRFSRYRDMAKAKPALSGLLVNPRASGT